MSTAENDSLRVSNRELANLLRSHGLRVTPPRMSTLKVVYENPHADVEQIRELVRQAIGTVSIQTIYGVLHSLTTANLLSSFSPAGSPARFEIARNDNHHHLVCRNCGHIEDVPCAVGYRPCLNPKDDHGYVLDEAQVIYWGICTQCQELTPDPEPITNPVKAPKPAQIAAASLRAGS